MQRTGTYVEKSSRVYKNRARRACQAPFREYSRSATCPFKREQSFAVKGRECTSLIKGEWNRGVLWERTRLYTLHRRTGREEAGMRNFGQTEHKSLHKETLCIFVELSSTVFSFLDIVPQGQISDTLYFPMGPRQSYCASLTFLMIIQRFPPCQQMWRI